jgi:hypothetical protein
MESSKLLLVPQSSWSTTRFSLAISMFWMLRPTDAWMQLWLKSNARFPRWFARLTLSVSKAER